MYSILLLVRNDIERIDFEDLKDRLMLKCIEVNPLAIHNQDEVLTQLLSRKDILVISHSIE